MSARFRVLVPIQESGLSLPRSGLDLAQRSQLSTAFAIDTLDVVVRGKHVREVVVVSPDASFAALTAEKGCSFIHSSGCTSLNEQVDDAFQQTRGATDQMIAVVAADLPALDVAELDEVLETAGRKHETVHVTDLGGIRITIQCERASTFRSCLGADPSARQRPRGVEIGQHLAGLRCDVDTRKGLRIASHIGVGPATERAMKAVGRNLGSRAEPL